MRLQARPDGHGKILSGGNTGGKLRDLLVDMAVVEIVEHLAVENLLQQLEVDDEAGDRIDFAGNSDLQRVIVAMAVEVGALAEDPQVLLRSPLRVVIIVRGGELSLAGQVDHCGCSCSFSPMGGTECSGTSFVTAWFFALGG